MLKMLHFFELSLLSYKLFVFYLKKRLACALKH